MPKQYDYIIAGAGCAGLSLLYRILLNKNLSHKKILVIDSSEKNSNDRTWCFWETNDDIFQPIVYHQWNQMIFSAPSFESLLDISPYQYKMIRGLDFYNLVLNYARQFSTVTFKKGRVLELKNLLGKAVVILENETFEGDYIFSSILPNTNVFPNQLKQQKKQCYLLYQHFLGWIIDTEIPVFNPNQATLMDFNLDQKNGTTFMYVLPFTPNRALIEYTLFSSELLPKEVYVDALKEYIQEKLGIQSFTIEHQEYGVIPMTNIQFPQKDANIIYIGMAGGYSKPSTGYTFQFIQKQVIQIVKALKENKHPASIQQAHYFKHSLYDSVFLNVLSQHKISGSKLFTHLFKKNKPSLILKFLDNDTDLKEDLKIMSSVPRYIFLPAAINEIWNTL